MALNLIEKLKMQGYAIIKNALEDKDIAEANTVTNELIKKWASGEICSEDFWTYKPECAPSPVLYRIHNLERKHECLEEFIKSKRLMDIVYSVMGQKVVITAAALIIKMPFYGGEVPYHRDPIDVPSGSVYNFSVFLDDSTPENGCFEVVPGSHLTVGNEEQFKERPKGLKFISAEKGDIIIHDVRLIHGSAFSSSEKMRRSICMEFQPLEIFKQRKIAS
jgi:ectoine hydroxylase-related dioxygenase (phytanoyl-CoA dioxygenase family)